MRHADRLVRTAALFAALLLGAATLPGCAPAGAEEATGPGRGIERFGSFGPGLYRGGQPDEAGFAQLRRLGVRTVVDLRQGHDERELVAALGMECVQIPMPAGSESPAPRAAHVRRFLDVVNDPARRPVFVHCKAGRDRTGTLVAVFRMETESWTNEQALAEMRAYGFGDDHVHQLEFVESYRARGGASEGR